MALDAAIVFSPPSPLLGQHIRIGATSTTIPSIAAINGTFGINQIIALYNRRRFQLDNNGFNSFAYLTGIHIPAATINSFRALINTLRVNYGYSAFNFGADLVAGWAIKAVHIEDLRTALTFSSYRVGTLNSVYASDRIDDPYKTLVSQSSTGGPTWTNGAFSGPKVGKFSQWTSGTPNKIERARAGASFSMSGLTAANTGAQGTFTVSTQSWTNVIESFNVTVYNSASYHPGGSGSWYTDASGAVISIGYGFTGIVSGLIGNAGMQAFRTAGGASFLIVDATEFSSGGAGSSASGDVSSVNIGIGNTDSAPISGNIFSFDNGF